MQDMKRFARFWDIVYNSGNFVKTSKLLFKDGKVFENFFDFSIKKAARTAFSFERLYACLPQHFLYFFPLPQGHGSFLPTLWT